MEAIKQLAIVCYSYCIKYCLAIKRGVRNKVVRYFFFCICAPFFLVRIVGILVYENTIGSVKVGKIKKYDELTEFDNELSIVAIAKNEGLYIREWIEYYKLLGVGRIYLYDNESSDKMKENISSYIESGFVVYHFFPGQAKQLDAYNHAIQHYKYKSKFMAMIDCDEFLMPCKRGLTLSQAILEVYNMENNAGGIGVNWCVYGSSGKIKYEEGLIIERFLMRAEDQAWNNKLIKTVVNPRLVKEFISPHFPIYKMGAWSVDSNGKRVYTWFINDVNFTYLRCNHYFCKSVEEFKKKQSRGLADRINVRYDMTKFDKYNVNDLFDNSMLKYADKIKKEIGKG